MKAVLNIGLQWSEQFGHGVGQWHPNHVMIELKEHGFAVEQAVVKESGTEKTLVCLVSLENVGSVEFYVTIWMLAEALWQDCIAYQKADKTGYLVGPYGEMWGEFDPAYFMGI